MIDEVPEAWKDAAEEVRAHLVALRGGAPFLSSRDAALLVGWLDQGVGVGTIVTALERAAEARRKARSRIPLSLAGAKRHLAKVARGGVTALPAGPHPFEPLGQELKRQAARDPRGDALAGLAAELSGLPVEDAETLLRGALGAVRRFFTGAWDGMGAAERADRLHDAGRELEGIAQDLDEATLIAATEEAARDRLRQDYPLLTAARLWDLVHM